ncbi:hypothetical protein HY837_05965 [archaeon]|nr:hypothetical protein [archaeon]
MDNTQSMIIIFNWIGLAILIFSSLIIFKVVAAIPLTAGSFYFLLGILFMIIDGLVRFVIIKKYYPKSNLKGGSLFFIPVYILGIVSILLGIILTIFPPTN